MFEELSSISIEEIAYEYENVVDVKSLFCDDLVEEEVEEDWELPF